MKYKLIFTEASSGDDESIMKGLNFGVLIKDENDRYYTPHYMDFLRVQCEFGMVDGCFFESNLVILDAVIKKNIIASVSKLHKQGFTKHWVYFTEEELDTLFFPKDTWEVIEIEVHD